MSAPRYTNKNYQQAADEYNRLAHRYTGENAYRYSDIAAEKATSQAKGYAESEGAAAQNLARNAGYSRARAAQEGAAARANAYKNAYSNSYSNASNNINSANNAALQAQGAMLNGALQQDANRYQSESNRYGAAMGAVGGVFTGAANALSDENKKDIVCETNADERRAFLLKKLRG